MIENWFIFQYINLSLASLSILGCLFIIIIFSLYKSIRSFAMEQVMYLTFSCLIATISYILQGLDPNLVKESGKDIQSRENINICKIQSFLMVWFENSQFISSTLIAFTVYRSVIFSEDFITGKSKSRRIIYLIAIFLFPFLFSLIGLIFFSVFGPSNFWCYIKLPSKDGEINLDSKVFYALNYTVFWILIGLNFYFNIKIISFIKKEFISNENEIISARNYYIRKLVIFPIVQSVLIIPGTINRFIQLVFQKDFSILIIIQVTFACSSGFIYSIVYGLNDQIKTLLKNTYNYYMGREQIVGNNNSNSSFQDSSSNFDNSLHHLDNRVSFIGERGSL